MVVHLGTQELLLFRYPQTPHACVDWAERCGLHDLWVNLVNPIRSANPTCASFCLDLFANVRNSGGPGAQAQRQGQQSMAEMCR